MTTPRPDRSLVCLGVIAVLLAGCPTVPSRTMLTRSAENVDASNVELRIRAFDFANRFANTIEMTANQIQRESTDPAIRRNALLLKAYAIPEAQRVAFSIEPLIAIVDLWVLTIQLRDYLTDGPGADDFGAWQPLVIAAAEQLEADIRQIAESLTIDGDVSGAEEEIRAFAESHPIESQVFLRDSIVSELADSVAPENQGTLALLGSMSRRIDDLSGQVGLIADDLPRQIRWQVEVGIDQVVSSPMVSMTLAEMVKLAGLLERMTVVVEGMPELIGAEREAVLAAIREERIAVLSDIDAQRVATLIALQGERAILLAAISAERMAVLADLRAERIAVMAEIRALMAELVAVANQLRAETMDDIESMSVRLMQGSTVPVSEVVDHVFLRFAQVLGASILLAGLLGLFVFRFRRRV